MTSPPLRERLAPLRGIRLALALAWVVAVALAYLAARELGLALVP